MNSAIDGDGSTEVAVFGPLKHHLTRPLLAEELPLPGTVAELREFLEERAPGLLGCPYRIAVDEVIRKKTDVITSVREIALMVPFGGG